ncbi:MAG: VIT domain-containing protein, partial [Planctomycetota bacterium]
MFRSLTSLLAVATVLAAPGVASANFALFEGSPIRQGEIRIPSTERNRVQTLTPQARDTKPDAQQLLPDRFVLKETNVEVDVSGVLARVRVEQVFQNPYANRLEAVYVFPLPESAAVDRYAFQIGEKVVRGVVREKEKARAQYEQAKNEGKQAALLEQERANVFTQSLANIPPSQEVKVHIEYVHPLHVDASKYSLRFPMVVAPRFSPGSQLARPNVGRGWARDTSEVPDASRVSPKTYPRGKRNGNDVRIKIRVDAGFPIRSVVPVTHEIDVQRPDDTHAVVQLKNGPTIANKDFVVEFDFAAESASIATLTHRPESDGDGYVMVMLQPERDASEEKIVARDVVLVLDRSGSMRGRSIQQLRIFTQEVLAGLLPQDRFRVIAFSSHLDSMTDALIPATAENIERAKSFVRNIQAGSGTHLLPALQAAIGSGGGEETRTRHLYLFSDALVGNDDRILGHLAKRAQDVRIFPVAIGAAPNHYLMDMP